MKRILVLLAVVATLTACNKTVVEYVCAPNPKHPQTFWDKAANQLETIAVHSPELVILLNERDNFGEAAKRCAAAMRNGKKKNK